MKKFYFFFVLVLMVSLSWGQASLTNGSPIATIDFSSSTSTGVGSNPSTAYTGAGFEPGPTTAGRLNSNAWALTGWSDGALVFGGTRTTASTDYTRGASNIAVSTGGMYAFTGAPGSVSNPSLMFQPGGSDWVPGTLTLRIKNDGTTIITELAVTYNLYVRNDQGRSNSFNFSHSVDDVTYAPVGAVDYTSTATLDALGWVLVGLAPSRSTTITGLNIAPGSFYYIRWSCADVGGAGSRDEFGLDDISVTGTFAGSGAPDVALSSSNPAVAAGNILQGNTTILIYEFDLAVTTASVSLTGVTVTTAGTYAVSDFSSFRCWYSADNIFNPGSDQLLSSVTPATTGDQVFTPFTSQVIGTGTTGYIFITANVACNAVPANTISVNAITTGQISFASANKTGIAFEGGLQTITAATPNNATGFGATNGNAQSSVNWTNPTGCYNEIMIVAATTNNTGTPTGDGTAYNANTAFGAGTALGNGFVVYKGNTSPQDVTALTNGTTYYFKIFTRFGTTWSSGVEVSATPTAPVVTTYTWVGGNAAFTTSSNWSPARTTPDVTDILEFNNASTVTLTGVPTQTIGKLLVSNNTTVNLQAGAANTLTIGGGTGIDLSVAAGSSLIIAGGNALTIIVATGATGTVAGNMTFTAAPHKLDAVDAIGITFNSPAIFTQGTGCTGNIFTNAGTASAIVFATGSVFVQNTGSNPFALTSPSSKVIFQTGSLFKVQQNAPLSLAGRTYANLEINFPTFSQSQTGVTALTVYNLTITDGTLNLNLTTGGTSIKGNISVAAGETLTFTPASASNITFNGTAVQSINNSGTLSFGTNASVTVNNNNGVTVNTDIALGSSATLTLTNSIVTLGSNNLSVTNITGGSATSYIRTNGTGALTVNNITTGKTLPIGNAQYNPLIIGNGSGHNWTGKVADGIIADPGFSTAKAVLVTWDVTPSVNPPAGAADITFQFNETSQVGASFNTATSVRAWNRSTGVWLPAGATGAVNTIIPTAATVKIMGLNTFSPYGLATVDGPLPVKFTNFIAYPQGSGIKVDWSNLTESMVANYKVERSADGQTFAAISTISPVLNNGGKADYSFFDANPVNGINFYRIQSLEVDGQKLYSVIVKVDIRGGKTLVSIYPNPVSGNIVSFQTTALLKGQYTVRVINAGGQTVFSRSFQHAGGALTEALQLPANIIVGIYSLQVSDGTMNTVRKFIIR